ncbi:PEGA domain-containing protein [Candidatus Daviesbacteria bacterium]|nr:PEGA domain-containing protein [Candidatus Daviesbacteria bacterium]
MKKALLGLLAFLSIIALLLRFGYEPLIKTLGIKTRAGVRVTVNDKAKVYLNNKEVGTTPYLNEDLTQGEYLVKVEPTTEATSSAKAFWQGYVDLNNGTLTVVNRELASTKAASSGEVITLSKGAAVTVVSQPSAAEVTANGKSYGRTPLSIKDLPSAEHQFIISKDGYLKRSIRATVIDGFNLTLNVDLAISEPDLSKNPTIPISQTAQVIVKSTPTGFLRVRSSPSTNAQEIARVNSGETLTLLEEIPNWNRVRLSDGKEGYVSSVYTEKKNP